MFPSRVCLLSALKPEHLTVFGEVWQEIMRAECHLHSVWKTPFVSTLSDQSSTAAKVYELATVWSLNMVVGSYCFPRYVAALAARAEDDAVRYGLLENAWDEAGGYGHTARSHFWLAVRLARLLGFSDEEIEQVKPLPEAQIYTDEHYKQCCHGGFGFALGMICLIEEFTTPEFTMIFNAYLRSCQEGLPMATAEFVLQGGAEYFTANIADDERHREEMPLLVATWLARQGVDLSVRNELLEGIEPVRKGIQHSIQLRKGFFDGIYDYVDGGRMARAMLSA